MAGYGAEILEFTCPKCLSTRCKPWTSLFCVECADCGASTCSFCSKPNHFPASCRDSTYFVSIGSGADLSPALKSNFDWCQHKLMRLHQLNLNVAFWKKISTNDRLLVSCVDEMEKISEIIKWSCVIFFCNHERLPADFTSVLGDVFLSVNHLDSLFPQAVPSKGLGCLPFSCFWFCERPDPEFVLGEGRASAAGLVSGLLGTIQSTYSQLPSDVIDKLLAEIALEKSKWDHLI